MKKIDVKILSRFSDKYVAYVDGIVNILASASTIKDLEQKLKKKKISNATITYIPPANKSFSPYAYM